MKKLTLFALLAFLALAVSFGGFTPTANAQTPLPRFTGPVTDLQHAIKNPGAVQSAVQTAVSQSGGKLHGIYAVTVPNLYGRPDATTLATDLYRVNNLGTGDVLLLVVFTPHQDKVVNAASLDPYMGSRRDYLEKTQMPNDLRSGNFDGAFLNAINSIGSMTKAVPAPVSQPVAPSTQPASVAQQQSGGFNWLLFFVLLVGFVVLVVVVLWLRSQKNNGQDNDGTSYDYQPQPRTDLPESDASGPVRTSRGSRLYEEDDRPLRRRDYRDPGGNTVIAPVIINTGGHHRDRDDDNPPSTNTGSGDWSNPLPQTGGESQEHEHGSDNTPASLSGGGESEEHEHTDTPSYEPPSAPDTSPDTGNWGNDSPSMPDTPSMPDIPSMPDTNSGSGSW